MIYVVLDPNVCDPLCPFKLQLIDGYKLYDPTWISHLNQVCNDCISPDSLAGNGLAAACKPCLVPIPAPVGT